MAFLRTGHHDIARTMPPFNIITQRHKLTVSIHVSWGGAATDKIIVVSTTLKKKKDPLRFPSSFF